MLCYQVNAVNEGNILGMKINILDQQALENNWA